MASTMRSSSTASSASSGGKAGAKTRTTRGRRQDTARVSGSQGYEVGYFARKHGITAQQARDLIKKVGNVRSKLNEAAEKLKTSLV